MNLDDLLCAGIYDNIVFNSTIDRNKNLIPGEVLEAVITGTSELFDELSKMGIHIHYLGGETADVGDVVRTIAVNGTMCARWSKDRLITNDKITAGDVIVGFAGYGRSTYEKEYNSGIGSNGLTSARHDVLNKHYTDIRESYDPALEDDVTYIGKYRLTDTIPADGRNISVGKLLLSPTRTFAPLVRDILHDRFDNVHGMIHCSGGGQTKMLKYLPEGLRIVKETLLPVPPVFDLIREQSGAVSNEMYQVFNMGCRLEIICEPGAAQDLIRLAAAYNIQGQVTGRIEKSDKKELLIMLPEETLHFHG
jgi:phosphoribosylformylglycinamidine cyclo-ligase